jgi:hypothetical protein
MRAIAIRRSLAAAAACAGCLSLVMTGGTVGAAVKPATLVLSDTSVFSGTITPGSTSGTFNFNSTKCALTSDVESTKFPCTLTGTITVPATGNPTGTFTLSSADGKTTGTFTLTPIAGTSSFAVKGKAKEMDAPDPGGPPTSYAGVVKGTVTPNLAAMTMTGKIKIFESSTAP